MHLVICALFIENLCFHLFQLYKTKQLSLMNEIRLRYVIKIKLQSSAIFAVPLFPTTWFSCALIISRPY